ncbi:MAG: TonB-dependent receptor [Acidobacteriota bacterium]
MFNRFIAAPTLGRSPSNTRAARRRVQFLAQHSSLRTLQDFARGFMRTGVLVVLFALISPVVAAEHGRVSGVVVDPSGAKVAGARVSLRDASGTAVYEARTESEGQFSIAGVAEGHYRVTAEAVGFTQAQEANVDVRAGAEEAVTVRLAVAAISDQMVVTATRTETATSELAGSVTVLTSEGLRLENQSQISESLRVVPGLSVAQTGGRGGLTSIFARGGESDYNKVLIDGVAVNAAGGTFDFASLTTENIERVEVVRGPQSALFGSDAMTSVIQLITKRGTTQQPAFEFSGEGGSFDFHRETARLSGLANWFDYSASYGYQSTEGRFRNSDYLNRSASTNLGFRLNPSAELRVTARSNNNSLGVPGPTADLFADPDQRQRHRDIALGTALNLRSTSRWRHTARFVYSEFESHNFDPASQDLTLPNTPPVPFGNTDFAFTFSDHQKRAGFQYQTIAAITSSNLLTGGVDFEHESAVFDDGFSRVSPTRNNLGIYVQDQAAFRGRLFVTAGVRVERNTSTVPEDLRAALIALGSSAPSGDVGFGVSANPKIAASFIARAHREGDAVGMTRLKASFGTGIKEPKLDEAFSPSIFFLGNPKADPERATSFDVGITQEFFNRRGNVDLTYFDGRFRDQIAFVFDPLTFGPISLPDGTLTNFINVERATARGIELTVAARPLLQLRVFGSYTFLHSNTESAFSVLSPEIGQPLLRRARNSGSLEVSWAGLKYDLGLDGSFVGKRRDFDAVTFARFIGGRPIFNDGYAKLNASGSYRAGRFVTLFARAENLLNQDYQEVLGFPAYRLNFSAGLRVRVGGAR